MVVNGLFDIRLNLHLQYLRFCFFGVLQHELEEIKSLWNSHPIRHIKNSNSPGGRPDALYFTPEGLGVTDCKFPLDSHDVITVKLHHYLYARQIFWNYRELSCKRI